MAAAETTAVEAAETKTSQDEEEEYAYDPTTTTPAVIDENFTQRPQLHRRSVLVDRLCFSVYDK